MASDDPFAEPDDAEKTVIKPNPGGRLSVATPTPTAAQQPSQSSAQVDTIPDESSSSESRVEQGMTGMNRLNAAASTLFSLISRIRNRAQHMEADQLRRSVVAEIRNFESRALTDGIPNQDVKVARYAICATLDDVVLNTPWGSESSWSQQSMVSTFHKENVGGDRFFDLLARLEQNPGKNIVLLEFLYLCLSLGFEGRLRVEANGSDKHMQIRAGLARTIRAQRSEIERGLSPNWEGLQVPHRVLSIWKPVWITAGVVAALATVTFLSLNMLLDRSTERVNGQMSVLTAGVPATLFRRAPPPPPPPAPPINQFTEVEGFLEEEITERVVELFQDNQTITIRLAGSGMFAPGSDTLQSTFDVPISRVAQALNGQAGQVIVVGHSDSIPVGSSSRFGSNMELSLARAESVTRKLASQLDDESRIQAQARGDKEPIASNETREGRAKNRRIEILLVRKVAN